MDSPDSPTSQGDREDPGVSHARRGAHVKARRLALEVGAPALPFGFAPQELRTYRGRNRFRAPNPNSVRIQLPARHKVVWPDSTPSPQPAPESLPIRKRRFSQQQRDECAADSDGHTSSIPLYRENADFDIDLITQNSPGAFPSDVQETTRTGTPLFASSSVLNRCTQSQLETPTPIRHTHLPDVTPLSSRLGGFQSTTISPYAHQQYQSANLNPFTRRLTEPSTLTPFGYQQPPSSTPLHPPSLHPMGPQTLQPAPQPPKATTSTLGMQLSAICFNTAASIKTGIQFGITNLFSRLPGVSSRTAVPLTSAGTDIASQEDEGQAAKRRRLGDSEPEQQALQDDIKLDETRQDDWTLSYRPSNGVISPPANTTATAGPPQLDFDPMDIDDPEDYQAADLPQAGVESDRVIMTEDTEPDLGGVMAAVEADVESQFADSESEDQITDEDLEAETGQIISPSNHVELQKRKEIPDALSDTPSQSSAKSLSDASEEFQTQLAIDEQLVSEEFQAETSGGESFLEDSQSLAKDHDGSEESASRRQSLEHSDSGSHLSEVSQDSRTSRVSRVSSRSGLSRPSSSDLREKALEKGTAAMHELGLHDLQPSPGCRPRQNLPPPLPISPKRTYTELFNKYFEYDRERRPPTMAELRGWARVKDKDPRLKSRMDWFDLEDEFSLPGLEYLKLDPNPDKVDELEKEYLARSRAKDEALQAQILAEYTRAESARLAAEQAQLAALGLRKSRTPWITSLSRDWERKVDALADPGTRPVKSGGPEVIDVSRGDFKILMKHGEWLNDNSITAAMQHGAAYINKAAGITLKKGAPKCVAFNTFFFTDLAEKKKQTNKVQAYPRTTKRVWGLSPENFLEVESILIPVNAHHHWTFAMIRPQRREIAYVDSFHNPHDDRLELLHEWMADFLGKNYHREEWKRVSFTVTTQTNGYDCGVWTITNSILLAMGIDPSDCTESQMRMQRRRIAGAILNGGFHGSFDLSDL
ncbi:hypothetical protein JX266_003106 [Neoarthrinium moseri]|nr:hypothetical protein JX266_003106 [Neoarthrinium moseri]